MLMLSCNTCWVLLCSWRVGYVEWAEWWQMRLEKETGTRMYCHWLPYWRVFMLWREGPTEIQSWVFGDTEPLFYKLCLHSQYLYSVLSSVSAALFCMSGRVGLVREPGPHGLERHALSGLLEPTYYFGPLTPLPSWHCPSLAFHLQSMLKSSSLIKNQYHRRPLPSSHPLLKYPSSINAKLSRQVVCVQSLLSSSPL